MLQEHEQKIFKLEIRVEALEKDNSQMKDQIFVQQAAAAATSHKLDALLAAIVGDEKLKTTGIMQRLESIEVVTNFVKELRWKAVGALIVLGWAWAFGAWLLEKLLK